MKLTDIPSSELEFLANSEGLRAVFEDMEKRTFEQMVDLPFWASRKRMAALVERIRVIRDVQNTIAGLRAYSKVSAGQRG